jgi:hypothetical protein
MTGAVKLVPIAAGPTRLGLYDCEIYIEISVLTLIFLNEIDYFLYLLLKVGAILT